MTLVAAVAGRLVEPDEGARFPATEVPRVQSELRRLLERYEPSALVASAARGADLLALEAARGLGIRCRIVLPFGVNEFRQTSVGGDPAWTRRFDAALADAIARSDLVILPPQPSRSSAYEAATKAVLAEARGLTADATLLALVVWDGRPTGPDDHTAHFLSLAAQSGCIVEEVRTS